MKEKIMLLLALLMLCSGSSAFGQNVSSPVQITEKIGPCIVFAPAGIGHVNLVNACDECRTAVMSWCDGSIKRVNVPAYGDRKIKTCAGTVTLATDVPCRKDLTQDQLKDAMGKGSCSASNDVGDTCSISCPEGQSANCVNATGANQPDCFCK